ncbi:hypothetical protein CTRI78_v007391 [Colletotrichum trifolii]|uniref:Uncharacterized protein n=1 Tax=Colletotrichum trifolii TaxID=5466 RepID=A0A4R8R662_COLTR|nr:hypothetical protein CTRI78_v007391 [Colletotrichum trifolii]
MPKLINLGGIALASVGGSLTPDLVQVCITLRLADLLVAFCSRNPGCRNPSPCSPWAAPRSHSRHLKSKDPFEVETLQQTQTRMLKHVTIPFVQTPKSYRGSGELADSIDDKGD